MAQSFHYVVSGTRQDDGTVTFAVEGEHRDVGLGVGYTLWDSVAEDWLYVGEELVSEELEILNELAEILEQDEREKGE